MSNRKKSKSDERHGKLNFQDSSISEDESDNELVLPDLDNCGSSGSDDDSSDDVNENTHEVFPNLVYRKVFDKYTESQNKLQSDHIYEWSIGEKLCSDNLEDQCLMTDSMKEKSMKALLSDCLSFLLIRR